MRRRRTDLVRVTGFLLVRDGKGRADGVTPARSPREGETPPAARESQPAERERQSVDKGNAASGNSNQNAYVSRLYITVVASSSPAVDSA